jgi:tRNA-specific 2-thiouridylase
LSDQYIKPKPGPILLLPSLVNVGRHKGLHTLTIGQKVPIPGMPHKIFVCEKDTKNNVVYVVNDSEHAAMAKTTIVCRDWKWMWNGWTPPGEDFLNPEKGMEVLVKFRYAMQPMPCRIWQACVLSLPILPFTHEC